ncbi:DUF6895 family protein [Streptomyces sp. ME19-01-6]|uniref:DUF6895 family protein n=1 Tax=Streptomyces sp. ME19-01-6 TaxID=3028686 RepID=UPI0039F57AEB
MKEGALLYERLLRHPLATDVLECYAHFARTGHRHPGLERLIPHFAAMGAAHVVEHVPRSPRPTRPSTRPRSELPCARTAVPGARGAFS